MEDASSNLASTPVQGHIGVVDIMVQRDADVLRQLQGAEEFLYVSGIAVLKDYRCSYFTLFNHCCSMVIYHLID